MVADVILTAKTKGTVEMSYFSYAPLQTYLMDAESVIKQLYIAVSETKQSLWLQLQETLWKHCWRTVMILKL